MESSISHSRAMKPSTPGQRPQRRADPGGRPVVPTRDQPVAHGKTSDRDKNPGHEELDRRASRSSTVQYRPPRGSNIRPELRREGEALASRYYHFLSGHASNGSYLCDKIRKIESNSCWPWWCNSGERQSTFHLVARCRAWSPHAKRMWKRIGKVCGWKPSKGSFCPKDV